MVMVIEYINFFDDIFYSYGHISENVNQYRIALDFRGTNFSKIAMTE